MSGLNSAWLRLCQRPRPSLPPDGIVLSTQVQLQRNLAGLPFQEHLNERQQRGLCQQILSACNDLPGRDWLSLSLEDSPDQLRAALIERQLLHPELLSQTPAGSAAILTLDERACVQVGVSDHALLNCQKPGLASAELLEQTIALDTCLDARLGWASHPRFGFLTRSPSDTGTGLHLTYLVHLPALTRCSELRSALRGLSRMHLRARGLYGENAESVGDLFLLSNQRTLGLDEHDLVNHCEEVVRVLTAHEHMARTVLAEHWMLPMTDQVERAVGVLSRARLLSAREALELLSGLRLGVALGLVPSEQQAQIDSLFLLVRRGHLCLAHEDASDELRRKEYRAQRLRQWIASWN